MPIAAPTKPHTLSIYHSQVLNSKPLQETQNVKENNCKIEGLSVGFLSIC